ncbi:ribonuclease H-like domain-containing protein [Tanacetum coccineum]
MLAPSGGGLILYQAYGNLYAMTGRKAHLLEDKKIPSVGVFDEVYFAFGRHLEEIHVTWAHLEKKRTRLQTYTNMAQEFLYSGWRRHHKYNVTRHNDDQDGLARLMNLLNDNGVSSANANMTGFFNGNTYFVIRNMSLGWIVDSGSNQHMIVSAKILINIVDISNLGLTVGHPNGTQALITKIGDLKINKDITLYDVLVVPEYTVSLLSVHKLLRDNKFFVGFDESNYYIRDLKANMTMGIGRQFNGLYLFDVDNACKIVSNNCIGTCFVSKTLWHQRLGHPADQVLDALKTTLNLDSHSTSDHLCDTCNKAKQTREPFPLSDHKSSKIGE